MSEEQKRIFIELYLDWFNNYVSITKFGHDTGLTYTEAQSILCIGKRLHESTTTQRMVQTRIIKQS
jgi:ABC-type Mn2+/Zn2+ transport system ATPase subunit